MTEDAQLEKAHLYEVEFTEDHETIVGQRITTVQFNPETLKVALSNQKAGGEQAGSGSVQFVGAGTTKLSVELVFDVTTPEPPTVDGAAVDDVRRLTAKVAHFMVPTPEGDNFKPRGVRFLWGTFLFDGVMDSMNEVLEFFSSDGRPLRASVTIEMSKQEIREYQFGRPNVPGTRPTNPARAGESVQGLAGREGRPEQWRRYADGGGVENPRRPNPGTALPSRPGRGG